jgi:hypothetical protein
MGFNTAYAEFNMVETTMNSEYPGATLEDLSARIIAIRDSL